VIGGGIIGCSIAYHVAASGRSVLLVEKAAISHGASWHAAGLLGQLRGSKLHTRFYIDAAAIYDTLEEKTGQAIGWKRVGSLKVARNVERLNELQFDCERTASFGLEAKMLSRQEIAELAPALNSSDLLGALWIASDGLVNPADACVALARGVRQNGGKIMEGVTVEGVEMVSQSGSRPGVETVRTSKGDIKAGLVVNAAGLWARELGILCGVDVPSVSLEHQYAVFQPLPEIADCWGNFPTIRDPCAKLYLKPEAGGKMLVGGWEKGTVPSLGTGQLPMSFGPELFEENMERFEQHALNATHLIPGLAKVGMSTMVNGPIPFTPDGNPLIGWAPEIENMFICAGFHTGIGAGPGVGAFVSKWLYEGRDGPPPLTCAQEVKDLEDFAPGRFSRMSTEAISQQSVEIYGGYYSLQTLSSAEKSN